MKILLLSPFPPFRGGIAQFGSRLLNELRLLEPDILPINYSRLYPGFLFPGKTQLEQGTSYPGGILHGYNPYKWQKARTCIKKLKPDIVVSQWWHPFFAPCLAASVPCGVKTAAVCHNVIPHESFPFGRGLSRMFLKRQNLLVVHSEAASINADRMNIPVLRLFHPVYDQYLNTGFPRSKARQKLGLHEDQTALLFFGLIREYKGFDLLIKACESLPGRFRIIAAGENYTKDCYVSQRLHWENRFIPDDEVGTWFNAADIVVLPYRSATQSGIAQIALSFGKPIVVTPEGGLPEVVENGITGTVAGETSAKALADAIEVCEGFCFEKETEAAVRRKADQFSWRTYASSLLENLS